MGLLEPIGARLKQRGVTASSVARDAGFANT